MKISYISIIAIIGYLLAGTVGYGTINLVNENDSFQTELQILRSELSSSDIVINELQSDIIRVNLKLDELNQNYSLLASINKSLTNDLEMKIQENKLLKNSYDLLILEHDEIVTNYSLLQETYIEQNSELNSVKIDLNQTQEDNILLNVELSDLRNEYNQNIDNYSSLVDNYNSLVESYNGLLGNNTDLVDEFNTLLNNNLNLLNDYNNLINDFNDLVSDYNELLSGEASLQDVYDELKVKYDLWRSHADLAPKARTEYGFIGYISNAGDYYFDQTMFLISFPDPENCLRIGFLSNTGSMRPAMHGGHNTIGTTCFVNNDFQEGDIIVYDDDGTSIIHQIIEIRTEGVITKGINNEVTDSELVLWENIIALIIAIIY